MTKIQVGFRSIIYHVYFTVLERAHGAGVHVQIGIKLLQGHFVAPILQQGTNRGRCDTFTQ